MPFTEAMQDRIRRLRLPPPLSRYGAPPEEDDPYRAGRDQYGGDEAGTADSPPPLQDLTESPNYVAPQLREYASSAAPPALRSPRATLGGDTTSAYDTSDPMLPQRVRERISKDSEHGPITKRLSERLAQGSPPHPKHGLLRTIAETAAKAYLGPDLGGMIAHPKYTGEVEEYRRDVGDLMRGSEMEMKTAEEERKTQAATSQEALRRKQEALAEKGMEHIQWQERQRAPLTGAQQRLDAIDQAEKSGQMTPEDAAAARTRVQSETRGLAAPPAPPSIPHENRGIAAKITVVAALKEKGVTLDPAKVAEWPAEWLSRMVAEQAKMEAKPEPEQLIQNPAGTYAHTRGSKIATPITTPEGNQITHPQAVNQLSMAPLPGMPPLQSTGNEKWDNVLKKYPVQIQEMAQGLLTYDTIMPTGRNAQTPVVQGALRAAREADPTFDPKNYPVMQAKMKSATSGKEFGEIQAVNVAIGHLDRLNEAIEAMNNGDLTVLNRIANFYKAQTGQSAPTVFKSIVGRVSPELVRAYVGTGGEVGDRLYERANLNESMAPQVLRNVIGTAINLLGSKIDTTAQSWETVMKGKPYPLPSGKVLTGTSQEIYDRLAGKTKPPAQQREPAGGGTVKMKAPDGSISEVPASQVEHFKSKGATVVQ